MFMKKLFLFLASLEEGNCMCICNAREYGLIVPI